MGLGGVSGVEMLSTQGHTNEVRHQRECTGIGRGRVPLGLVTKIVLTKAELASAVALRHANMIHHKIIDAQF